MACATQIQPDNQGARKASPGGACDVQIEALSAVGERDAPGLVVDRLGDHQPAAPAPRRDSCRLIPARRDRRRHHRDDRAWPARSTCPQYRLACGPAYLNAEPGAAPGARNATRDPVERRGLERVADEPGGVGAELLIRLPLKVTPRHQPTRPGDDRG